MLSRISSSSSSISAITEIKLSQPVGQWPKKLIADDARIVDPDDVLASESTDGWTDGRTNEFPRDRAIRRSRARALINFRPNEVFGSRPQIRRCALRRATANFRRQFDSAKDIGYVVNAGPAAIQSRDFRPTRLSLRRLSVSVSGLCEPTLDSKQLRMMEEACDS